MKMTYKLHKRYRLPHFDYASTGYYFVTICTKDHICHLAQIEDEKIVLTPAGSIASWKCENNDEKMNLINQIPTAKNSGIPKNPMKSKAITLGKIMRWYKAKVKYKAGLSGYTAFAWQ